MNKNFIFIFIIFLLIIINIHNYCNNKSININENYDNNMNLSLSIINLSNSKNNFILRNKWVNLNYTNFDNLNLINNNNNLKKNDNNIILLKNGYYMIEIFGKTKDYREIIKYNKLFISTCIGIFINDKLENECWYNCDVYGRCNFYFNYGYNLKLNDKLEIKFKFDDNIDEFINNNNISIKNIDEYKYDYSNGCEYLMIKFILMNN